MRPALGSDWDLRVRDNRAYIERRCDGVTVSALSPIEAVTVGLMDGAHPVTQIDSLLTDIIGQTRSSVTSELVNRLGALLVDGVPRAIEHPLDALAEVELPDPREGLRMLPGPRVLHWWVTSFCPRQCVYCFARPKHGSHAPDVDLPRRVLRCIFNEAASLGAEHLLIAGAEPFLRRDLPEVMGDAIDAGLLPLVTTKHTINQALAARLSDAGVRHISISIDSLNGEENHKLMGSRAYGHQMLRTVENLKDVGVAFSFQAVVTRLNRNAFHNLARSAARLGAQVLQVVPFEPVAVPIGDVGNADLAIPDVAELDAEVATLQEQYPDLRIERFEELGEGSRAGFHCDIGMTKLLFLPNGVVHRCYKLVHDRRLDGRDLREVSVAEAWHDPGFRKIIAPPPEQYASTACGTCDRFQKCHSEGRCIYQAMMDHGNYTAPDRNCDGPYAFEPPN